MWYVEMKSKVNYSKLRCCLQNIKLNFFNTSAPVNLKLIPPVRHGYDDNYFSRSYCFVEWQSEASCPFEIDISISRKFHRIVTSATRRGQSRAKELKIERELRSKIQRANEWPKCFESNMHMSC